MFYTRTKRMEHVLYLPHRTYTPHCSCFNSCMVHSSVSGRDRCFVFLMVREFWDNPNENAYMGRHIFFTPWSNGPDCWLGVKGCWPKGEVSSVDGPHCGFYIIWLELRSHDDNESGNCCQSQRNANTIRIRSLHTLPSFGGGGGRGVYVAGFDLISICNLRYVCRYSYRIIFVWLLPTYYTSYVTTSWF